MINTRVIPLTIQRPCESRGAEKWCLVCGGSRHVVMMRMMNLVGAVRHRGSIWAGKETKHIGREVLNRQVRIFMYRS